MLRAGLIRQASAGIYPTGPVHLGPLSQTEKRPFRFAELLLGAERRGGDCSASASGASRTADLVPAMDDSRKCSVVNPDATRLPDSRKAPCSALM